MERVFVKAVYKYQARQPDEISLHVNDILQVKYQLDENWYYGRSYKCEGNFPVSYVCNVKLPKINASAELFAALKSFHGNEEGDLIFNKGDLVIGLRQVDKNWWKGHREGSKLEGIFPLTHVWCLKVNQKNGSYNKTEEDYLNAGELINLKKNKKAQEEYLNVNENNTENIYSEIKDVETPLGNEENTSVLKQHPCFTQEATSSLESSVKPYAKSLYPYEATREDELSFLDGEIIVLIQHYQGGWSEGTINGKKGLFPINYVSIIVDCEPSLSQVQKDNQEFNNAISELDYANEASNQNNNQESSVDDNAIEGETYTDTYGRVLYDFTATNPQQIHLNVGDTVTLIRKVNSDWFEARHDDGRVGFCPANYIEVFDETFLSLNGVEDMPTNIAPKLTNSSVIEPKVASSFAFSINSQSNAVSSQDDFPDEQEKMKIKTENTKKSKQASETSLPLLFSQLPNNDISQSFQTTSRSTALATLSPRVETIKSADFKTISPNSNISSLDSIQSFPPPSSLNKILSSSETTTNKSTDALINKQRAFSTTEQNYFISQLNIAFAKRNKTQQGNDTHISSPLRQQIGENKPIAERPSSYFGLPVPSRPAPQRPKTLHAEALYSASFEVPSPSSPKPGLSNQEKRVKIIEEIFTTEADFLSSISFCYSLFYKKILDSIDGDEYVNSDEVNVVNNLTIKKPSQFNVDKLFGNMQDVIRLSRQLLSKLRATCHTENDNIGTCFISLEESFKKTYAPYCKHHGAVSALINKYNSDEEMRRYMADMMKVMKKRMMVFDLASVLIKPVQRILKYPLLISQLDKNTDDKAADKASIKQATKVMVDVASYINEYKGRQEQDKQRKMSMSNRRFIETFTSFSVSGDDQSEEAMTKCLEIMVKNIIKEMSFSLTLHKNFLNSKEDLLSYISNFYFGDGDDDSREAIVAVDALAQAYKTLAVQEFYITKDKVERDILPHLSSLLATFQVPLKAIKKQKNTDTDYNKKSKDAEWGRSNHFTEQLQVLNQKALHVVVMCLYRYLKWQKNYHEKVGREMNKVFQFPCFQNSPDSNQATSIKGRFAEDHERVVQHLISNLSTVPGSFKCVPGTVNTANINNTNNNAHPTTSHQPFKQLQGLVARYNWDKLYRVKKACDGEGQAGLKLEEGWVVAVIKEVDPMGMKNKWFVDCGVSKGFISRSHLEAFTKEDFMKKQEHLQHEPSHQPHHAKLNLQNRLSSPVFPSATRKQEPKQTQQRSSFHVIPSRPLSPIKVYQSGLPTSTLPSVDTIQAKTAANPPYPLYPLSTSKIFSFHNSFIPTPSINRDKMSTSMNESTPFQPPIPHQPQKKVKALFDFKARSKVEFDLVKGHTYLLLRPFDLDDNPDWWLLTSIEGSYDKKYGYSPCNYVQLLE